MNIRDDRGSVLLLGMGLALIVFALVAALADIAVIRLARHELNYQADAAALAGAQAIDIEGLVNAGYLEQGPAFLVPLNAADAIAAVRSHLEAVADGDIHLVAVQASANTVTVSLSTPVRPPFTAVLAAVVGTDGIVDVQATAAAQTRVG